MTAPASQVGSYEIPRGTVLGKYEILRKLATGGMAEIYVARTRGTAGFEKLVVLKRILPNVASDPAFVQMFLDEARLAATLQHPNIADVYDVGEVAGTFFFTMEFIHGEDARAIRAATRKRNERPPLAVALAIVNGTAAALDYAHEKTGPQGPLGLVHRDISSSNILVSYDGAVKLVDFGIARATERETKTRTGTLKGKVPYMSPEQCRGHAVDRRSDLFSLGTVLYELSVGRRPFRGESDFQIMEQIVHHDARPPTQIDPDYPKALEAIVLKLLARDVRARYQTAEQVLHDLEELVQSHRLYASAKSISKYMRALFAHKIEAWEAAEREGITLGQHVQLTITAESQKSDLVTPPSALLALPPADLPTTGPYPRAEPADVAPYARPSAPMPIAPMPSLAPSRRGLVIVAAAVLTLAAVGGGYWFVTRQAPSASQAAAPTGEDPAAGGDSSGAGGGDKAVAGGDNSAAAGGAGGGAATAGGDDKATAGGADPSAASGGASTASGGPSAASGGASGASGGDTSAASGGASTASGGDKATAGGSDKTTAAGGDTSAASGGAPGASGGDTSAASGGDTGGAGDRSIAGAGDKSTARGDRTGKRRDKRSTKQKPTTKPTTKPKTKPKTKTDDKEKPWDPNSPFLPPS